jgi:hypothetical protein
MVTQTKTAGQTADTGKDQQDGGCDATYPTDFCSSNLFDALYECEDLQVLAVAAPVLIHRVATSVHNYLQRKRQSWRARVGSPLLQSEASPPCPESPKSAPAGSVVPFGSAGLKAVRVEADRKSTHKLDPLSRAVDARVLIPRARTDSELRYDGDLEVPVMLNGNFLPISVTAEVIGGKVALSEVRFRVPHAYERITEYWQCALAHARSGAPALTWWDRYEDWAHDFETRTLADQQRRIGDSLSAHIRRVLRPIHPFVVSLRPGLNPCYFGCVCGGCL